MHSREVLDLPLSNDFKANFCLITIGFDHRIHPDILTGMTNVGLYRLVGRFDEANFDSLSVSMIIKRTPMS
jgi:hypothetical protein